jgi:putative effector of murein hydrolase
LFGSIFGYTLLKWLGVNNPVSQGLAMGTAAHAIGAARSMQISANFGAYSSLGLIADGIFTAILTPYILQWLGHWINF